VRIIAPVRSRRPPLCPLSLALLAAFVSLRGNSYGHDFERTAVAMTFAADGTFSIDVTNDAAWLEHRLIPFTGPFADRIVLFVDSHEVRPDAVERIAATPPLTTYRLRGRVPLDARTLRWYYGLPIDPYPLTIRRADNRIVALEIAGDAWSPPIDLAGQFAKPTISATTAIVAVAALLVLPVLLRLRR
jgi:hypothetical protein